MGTGGALSLKPPTKNLLTGMQGITKPHYKYWAEIKVDLMSSIDQASRVISTGQLNMSPCLHFLPINLVVFQDS
jgi:hypothetical protein